MKLTDKLTGLHKPLHEKLLAGNTVYEGIRHSPHIGGGVNYGRPRKPTNQVSKETIQRRMKRTGG